MHCRAFILIRYALEDFSATEVAFFQAAIGAWAPGGGSNRRGKSAALGDILRRPLLAILLGVSAIGAPFMLISLGE